MTEYQNNANFASTMEITKETPIGECTKYPKVAEYLMENGLHCVGCFASQFENLEIGLKIHGKSDKEIDGIIKKLNELAK